MNEPFIGELRHLLQTYAKSRRIIRMQQGQGKQYLLRVHSVGTLMFHAEVLDVKTRQPAGFAHLPIVMAADMLCLTEDNQWVVVQNMYESTGARVTP